MTKFVRFLLLPGVIVALAFVVARHVRPPSLVGLWRDQSPAALLYEFRDDDSVWLIWDGGIRPVFRYKAGSDGQLVLYDGMGRRRELLFTLTNNHLILRERDDPAIVFIELQRER